MTDFDDEGGRNDKLIAALTAISQSQSSRLKERKQRKQQRQSDVCKAIAVAVEAWTSHAIHERGYIPVITDEQFLGYFSFQDSLLENPIQAVASSIFIPTREDTKRARAITPEVSAAVAHTNRSQPKTITDREEPSTELKHSKRSAVSAPELSIIENRSGRINLRFIHSPNSERPSSGRTSSGASSARNMKTPARSPVRLRRPANTTSR